jgi:two-component system response regulator
MSGPTVFLLVEDDQNDVLLVEMEFKRVAPTIRLLVVNDGQEAIQYLDGDGKFADRKKCPLPDVILLDLKMPKINGFDFLQWLRLEAPAQRRFIPVVVMSSSTLEEDIHRAYTLGANSYLPKPVDWKLFKERIRALGLSWAEHSQTPELRGK